MNRNYSFSVVSYANLQEIQSLLDSSKHWCYILHDKDKNEDGTTRAPHYHVLCTFSQNQSFKQVSEKVISNSNTFVEALRDVEDAYDYLTHDTPSSQSKYHYDKTDIVHDDEDYWARRIDSLRDSVEHKQKISADELVNDLVSDEFSIVAMGKKYGRDFIKNCRNYIYFRGLARAEIAYEQELKEVRENQRPPAESDTATIYFQQVLDPFTGLFYEEEEQPKNVRHK